MNAAGRRPLLWVVLVASVVLLVASVAVTVRPGAWDHRPGGMMRPGVAISGAGAVADLDEARAAAAVFADRWGLAVGEVMEFSNGFYAELVEPSGDLATEVLVDARTGAVQIEYGPAMMWNTAYGMHSSRSESVSVTTAEAQVIADEWLAEHRAGERAGEPEAFPGYFTLHTLEGDDVVGMLSVRASDGAVWFHAWHGDFIAMSEPDESSAPSDS